MKGFAENFHEEMERIKQEQGQAAERQEQLSAALDTLRQERQTADMAISFSISSQGKRIEGLEKQGGAILGRIYKGTNGRRSDLRWEKKLKLPV